MKAKCVLTLLVVLALSAASLMSAAGSAVHREAQYQAPDPVGAVLQKDGDGGNSADGGDDDRWGNASPDAGGSGEPGTSGGTPETGGEAGPTGPSDTNSSMRAIRLGVGVFFRTMLIVLYVR